MATNPGGNVKRIRQTHFAAIKVFALGMVLIALAVPHSAHAQRWEIEPSLELIATYTDNLYLSPDGTEIPDYIGQVNPGILISKQQGRFTTDIDYRLQSLFFADDSDLDSVYHQLGANATLEAVTERLFVDFTASVDQSVVDPSRSIPFSNVVATGNLGDVYFADINPYLVQQIGGSDTYIRMDYLWGMGRYDGFGLDTFSRVDDFEQMIGGLYIGTSDRETGFDWSATYDRQFVDYETIPSYRFERAGIAVGIPIARGLRLIVLGGVESDVIASRSAGGLDSDYWEAGFRIGSSQRSALELRVGERFFGTSYFGNLQYEGRRIRTSITYSENPSTSALDGPGSDVGTFSVGNGDPIFDGSAPLDDIDVLPIRTEAYIEKSLNARFELDSGKSLLFLAYTEEEREFLEGAVSLVGSRDGQNTALAGFAYDLGPRTNLELTVNWIRYTYAETTITTDAVQIGLAAIRRLGSDTDFRASIRYATQDSENVSGFGNYTENAVEIAMVKRF